MIDLGKQWPLNIFFFADKCKCLNIASLDATEPICIHESDSCTVKNRFRDCYYFLPNQMEPLLLDKQFVQKQYSNSHHQTFELY